MVFPPPTHFSSDRLLKWPFLMTRCLSIITHTLHTQNIHIQIHLYADRLTYMPPFSFIYLAGPYIQWWKSHRLCQTLSGRRPCSTKAPGMMRSRLRTSSFYEIFYTFAGSINFCATAPSCIMPYATGISRW